MRCLYCDTNIFTIVNFLKINKLFLCKLCLNKLIVIDQEIIIKNQLVHVIYGYNKIIKKLIIDLKVKNKIDISQKILINFKASLIKKYQSYYILAAPSYYLHDYKRGFNHVKATFSILKLPFLDLTYKSKDYKQSQQSRIKRYQVCDIININHGYKIKNKNILIVDDVLTTGTTLFTLKHKIQQYKPKKVKILVISRKII